MSKFSNNYNVLSTSPSPWYAGSVEITPAQQKKLQQTGKKYGLTLLLLHGSYATGKQYPAVVLDSGEVQPGSDLDLAYLPSQSLDLKMQLALHSDLADIFGDNYDRELDLKSLSHTDPLFQYEVSRHSLLLYGGRDTYDDFRAHAFFQFVDNQSLFNLERQLSRKLLNRFKQKYA